MYAIIDKAVSYTDENELQYRMVESIAGSPDGFEGNPYYLVKDLSTYSNGAQVQAGWRYYPDSDTFAPEPQKYYYAVINEHNIVTAVVERTSTTTEAGYIQIADMYAVQIGDIYKNGEFMSIAEANRIDLDMLMGLLAVDTNGGTKVSLSGKDVLAEIAARAAGLCTYYAPKGAVGNPNTQEGFRMLSHKSSDKYGWVLAFGSGGSVYSNYVNDSVWTGWKNLSGATV